MRQRERLHYGVCTIFLAKNNPRSDRTKDLAVVHKFVNEKIEDKTIELKYVKSRENWADIFKSQ